MSVVRSRRLKIRRLDGARHWQKIVDSLIYLLVLAGITPTQIRKSVNVALRKYAKVKPLEVPPVEEMEYSRILTQWTTDPHYTASDGQPADLQLFGERSFSSLVLTALPDANVLHALALLRRHHLIEVNADKSIHLASKEFLLKGRERAQVLGYTLSAAEGIFDTWKTNLTTRNLKDRIGRFQRTVIAERYVRVDVPAYDQFLRKEAGDFLINQDAWLKQQENQPGDHKDLIYIGVGVFGFRAK